MRCIVFKTKSTPSSAVYVRSDTHSLLVVTHISSEDQSVDPLLWQEMYERSHSVASISDLETIMGGFDPGTDSASIVLSNQEVFLGTCGSGAIYLKRGAEITEIVSEGFCASGRWEEGDIYVATTDAFLEHIGGDEGLTYYLDHYRPEEIVEMMQTYDEGQAYGFGIVTFEKPIPVESETLGTAINEVITTESTDEGIDVQESISKSSLDDPRHSPGRRQLFSQILVRISNLRKKFAHVRLRPTKYWLFVIIPTLFLIFLSVRQTNLLDNWKPNTENEYSSLAKSIDDDLNRATTESFLDAGQSDEIFESIEQRLATVSSRIKTLHATELTQLSEKIQQQKRELLRIQPVNITEYFDMIVENPQVTVTDLDLDGDTLYVLDGEKGLIYALSLVSRSYDVLTTDKLNGARQVAVSSGYVYALSANEGIYLIASSLSTQVIPRDSEWDKITDMKVFNSNIYMLDDGAKEIYKYVAIDTKSFATRVSYLSSEAASSFGGGKMMAIDGAVYTVSSTNIKKLISGNKGDFKAVFPNQSPQVDHLSASQDTEYVLALDSKRGAIYVLEKTGAFHGQIIDPLLVGASHVVATADNIYVVKGSKVYMITQK